MINTIGLVTLVLWLVMGVTCGRNRYLILLDKEDMSKRGRIVRTILWGIVRPPWLLAKGVWNFLSISWLRKTS